MSSPSVTSASGRLTTNAFGTSPAMSSGEGITAASATAGCCTKSASSSAGGTWKPRYLMSSFRRSTTYRYPSASAWPMSPVRNHPSPGSVYRVRLGIVQVALHDLRPAYPDLAVFVCGAVLPGLQVRRSGPTRSWFVTTAMLNPDSGR